jgi:hypothetical protein
MPLPLESTLTPTQRRADFFVRVAEFVCAQTPVAAYREVALDKSLRNALWAPHWLTLSESSEHDAALFMCFLLACAMLRIDVPRAAAAIRRATDPGAGMKEFVFERGLLHPSSFDLFGRGKPAGA